MLHSGIDKHKDNCFIVTVNDQGTIVREARVKNTVAALTAYFQSFGKEEHRAVVESTTGGIAGRFVDITRDRIDPVRGIKKRDSRNGGLAKSKAHWSAEARPRIDDDLSRRKGVCLFPTKQEKWL